MLGQAQIKILVQEGSYRLPSNILENAVISGAQGSGGMSYRARCLESLPGWVGLDKSSFLCDGTTYVTAGAWQGQALSKCDVTPFPFQTLWLSSQVPESVFG